MKKMPANSSVLDNFYMIIINDYSLDRLTNEQIEAINKWVKKGGVLILGGGLNAEKSIAPLSEVSPVVIDGYQELESLSVLEEATGKTIEIEDSLKVSDAEVVDGEILYHEDNVPLFVLNKVNEGKVLYVAYDLADELLSTWIGNNHLWTDVLNKLELKSFILDNLVYYNERLTNAAEKIPTISTPYIKILTIILIVCIITFILVAFILLKRKDKQKWNGLFKPMLAVILILGIFDVGLFITNKQIYTHNVNYLELTEGNGKLQSSSGIYVRNSGKYELEFKDIDIITPFKTDNYGNLINPNNVDSKKSWISIDSDTTKVTHESVEFGGYRSTYVEKTLYDFGQIKSDLEYKNHSIVGTITNKIDINMHDVKIVYHNSVYEIGNFKAGESLEIDIKHTSSISLNGRSYVEEILMPEDQPPIKNSNNTREYDVANYFVNELIDEENPTYIIGWSEDDIIHPQVVEKDQQNESLTLVVSRIEISLIK